MFFDIETFDADLLYSMPPDEFVRLIGYRVLGKEPVITTDLDELLEQLRKARWVIGHNCHAFDLKAVFGTDSNEPLELTDAGRVLDTFIHAPLVHPAPERYTDRFGKTRLAVKPEQMKAFYGLDEQAFQLGVTGKTDDLKALAKEFGDPDLPAKDRVRDGFGKIPTDDPRYSAYLLGDLDATEAVSKALLKKGPLNDYALREQRIAARAAVISSNGWRVDRDRAQERVTELAARRDEIMAGLVDEYDFPATGSAPWATDEGKDAILAALAEHGITPRSIDWPKTPAWAGRADKAAEMHGKADDLQIRVDGWRGDIEKGEIAARSVKARQGWIERAEQRIAQIRRCPLPVSFGLSFGGQELIEITTGTLAEEMGRVLAELKGQRSLAQLALDSCHPDGFAHPDITMLQRSGRWSTSRPGITVWTSRGENAVEKAYFIPDYADEVILEIDYSQADSRIVAALSGDAKFAERFEPGADGHTINAIAAWGEEEVATDPAGYRQKAKVPGHGWSYRIGAKTLTRQTGMPVEEAKTFLDGMNNAFRRVVRWQDKASKDARRGYVIGEWGRKMHVEKGREFTQGPALLGQNGTREIVCDALLAMPYGVLRTVKAQIHDAIVVSIPLDRFEEYRDYLCELMTTTLNPRNGQPMAFPVSAGPPGANWHEAGH